MPLQLLEQQASAKPLRRGLIFDRARPHRDPLVDRMEGVSATNARGARPGNIPFPTSRSLPHGGSRVRLCPQRPALSGLDPSLAAGMLAVPNPAH